ncbi:hypothetical protein TNCV_1207711 [Trichonephila clavipes]|nr:hypothetical protein TNCV_1207711 [Trichonephila clavipes]
MTIIHLLAPWSSGQQFEKCKLKLVCWNRCNLVRNVLQQFLKTMRVSEIHLRLEGSKQKIYPQTPSLFNQKAAVGRANLCDWKAAFTPRQSSVERLANQKLHLGRDEVSGPQEVLGRPCS